jgi:cytochrome c-type biogenesis protein CcmH
METWIILLLMGIAAAGLLLFALWPRANAPKTGARKIIVMAAAALFVVAAPMVYFASSHTSNDSPSMDQFAALERWADGQGKMASQTAQMPTSHPDMSLQSVTEQLKAKLETNPDDLSGWILLGRSYNAMGEDAKALQTFEDVLKRWPDSAEARVAYAEHLMAKSDGRVTDEAKALLDDAVERDPSHVRARYNLALYAYQSGDYQSAHDQWKQLADGAPSGAPWLTDVNARLQEASAKLGTPVATQTPPSSAMPSPNQEQVRAAMQMDAGDRAAFIRSMVDGLAARLKDAPNDLEGWKRLGRSYGVLGDWQKAASAYEDGLTHFPQDKDLAQGLKAARSNIQ